MCVVLCLVPTMVGAQTVTPPDQVHIEATHLTPHRIEFKETTQPDSLNTLDAWVYVTMEKVHSWDEEQWMIQWMALTWNGTGVDRNMTDHATLSTRSRNTPFGIPAGALLESHYFGDSVAVAEVNPDGAINQRPKRFLGYSPRYNVISWPYVFAALADETETAFVLRGYASYADQPFFYRVDVTGDTTLVDALGIAHEARIFTGRASLDQAAAQAPEGPKVERITHYFVSRKAPYFLGKEQQQRQDGTWLVTKRWTMTQWQPLRVTPSVRVQEILQERARRLRLEPQELPWRPSAAPPHQ